MNNPFDSPRLLIQEAEENITRIEEGVEAFLGHNGRTIGVEIDPKTRDQLLYVQFPIDIPAKISMHIRAAIRDLRDALDHAVYASSVSIFGGDPKKTKFLVANDQSGLVDDINRGSCKDVHKDIIVHMLKEDACKTGNATVWALNHLRNKNTHKVVSLATSTSQGFEIVNGTMELLVTSPMNEWRSTRRRHYFARATPESKFNVQITPVLQIRLHNAVFMGQRRATEFLREALADVSRITGDIEQETAKILKP